MVELQSNIERYREAGIQVAAVSYDSVEILKKFAEANNITYPLLSDPESASIRAFGIHFQDGLPHPGTFLIGPDKVVRLKFFRDGYRERHDSEELLEAAANLSATP